jgi:16S rRNA (adenine1518-N6/adenine1519-N6)-dimethyltransferase
LRDAGVTPAKALGQHFLTDRNIVNRIVASAGPQPEAVVIEVGPGMGALTERLAESAGHVIAVEMDKRLAERLHETAGDKVTVVQADILSRSPSQLLAAAGLRPDTAYQVIGNLPYNIGAAVLRHFLEAEHQPKVLAVMLQREVADAICARPGDLGLLGVSVQVYAEPRRLFSVSPRSFYPPPKVMSAVIRLDVRDEPLVGRDERDRFFIVVRAGFSAPRKQIRNTLAQGLRRQPADIEPALASAGIEPTARPQELSVEDWRRLAPQIEV